jgi:ADP-ribose pyrophosphatase
MALARWKRLARRTVHRNPWWRYMRDDVLLPSDRRGEYHFVHTPGSVMVLPVREDGRLILVRQYRYLNDRDSIEFPAGGVKEGQDREEAARAELCEEAGYEAEQLEALGTFNPFNGVTDELCTVYRASGLRACAGQPDETEEFEQMVCTQREVRSLIADGRIWDGMTLAAWALLQEKERH